MPPPHPLLIDVVTGRSLPRRIDDPGFVDSALEHRVDGILWTRIESGHVEVPGPERDRLAAADFEAWARSQMLIQAARSLMARLDELEARAAIFKGIATEARWYSRMGERRERDLDIWLAPADVPRVAELISAMAPGHPLLPVLGELVAGGWVQSVDFTFGLPVDLHTDFFKLELLPTANPDDVWGHVETVEIDGTAMLGLDPNLALVGHLAHLNRDGFRRLLGFADVAKILDDPRVDFDVVGALLTAQGLEVPGLMTLSTVVETLGLDREIPRPGTTWRTRAWRRIWSADRLLWGEHPRVPRHRQFWMAYLAPGRGPQALTAMVRRWLPPSELLAFYYPEVPGPYIRRLVMGRASRQEGST